MKKTILTTVAISMLTASSLTPAFATDDNSDNPVLKHISLKEVEIIGVKNQTEGETSPVTRLDSAEISRADIKSMQGIAEITPNFFIPRYGSRMTSSIYVRGLGTRIDNPVIGFSVDNVPVFNKNAFDFDLIDIDRIDVLRGPQAILAGRNTMAGQVNFYTLSPWKYTGIKASAGFASGHTFNASVTASKQFSRYIASSLSAAYRTTQGMFRNSYNNGKVDKERSFSARWKLAARPSDWHSITNVAAINVSRQSGYPYAEIESGKINYNDTCFYNRTSFSDGLTAVWAGKRVVVTSVTAFQYLEDNMTLDQDFLPQDYFNITQKQHEWTLSQDLYAKGTRGNYQWTGGLFGFYRHNRMDAPVTFLETGINGLIVRGYNMIHRDAPIVWDSDSFVLGSDFHTPTRGVALYHESTWRPGNFTIDLGLRWSYENSVLNYGNDCVTSYSVLLPPPPKSKAINIHKRGRLSLNSSELLPKVSVAWRIPAINSSLYASFAEGYKAGGFNTQMFSDILQQQLMEEMGLGRNTYDVAKTVTYKPEKSLNYEIGFKGKVLDDRLGFGVTGFFIDVRDQQLTKFPEGTTTGRMMTNAGRTYSRGFEITSDFNITPELTFRASYGYTHATFKKYDDGKTDYSGKRVPYAPESTLYLSGYYSLPVSFWGITPSVEANLRGAGDFYWDEANSVKQNFYALLGANICLDASKWQLRLWASNLTDTKYNTFYFVSMRNTFVQKGDPRRMGVTLTVNI